MAGVYLVEIALILASHAFHQYQAVSALCMLAAVLMICASLLSEMFQ